MAGDYRWVSAEAAGAFERFELKYRIPNSQVPELRRFLAPWVLADAHGPGGAYQTTNLYFDTPDRALYQAHARSDLDRYKLRIRHYQGGGRCYFEIKRKIRDVIVKRRSHVPADQLAAVLDGDRRVIDASSNPTHLDEWIGRQPQIGAEPAYFIRYQREAYHGSFDSTCRVTLDGALAYQPASAAHLNPDSSLFRPLEQALVLELKFDRQFPRWVQLLVQRFDLTRVQFSKYLAAIDADRAAAHDPMPRSTVVRGLSSAGRFHSLFEPAAAWFRPLARERRR